MKPIQKILIIVFFSIISSGLARANTYTLLIGMDVINDNAYLKKYNKVYDQSGTSGVSRDIDIMNQIAMQNGHIVKELRAELATRQAILQAISEIGVLVKPGDHFLLYYSGHGDEIPDKSGDEKSGFDQVMVAFDEYLIDDEIDKLLLKYFTKTNNVMIVDACHSGSSYKNMDFFLDFKFNKNSKNKFMTENMALKQKEEISKGNITTVIEQPYVLLYLGATPDGKLAIGDITGGLLTSCLHKIIRDAIKKGDWNQFSYETLAYKLKELMKVENQVLQFLEIGVGAKEFAKSIPFKS